MNVDFSDDDDDSFLLAEEAVKALDDVEQQYMLSQAVDGHKSGEGWGRRSETSSLEGDGTVGSVSSSTAFTVQSLPVTQDPHQLSTSQIADRNHHPNLPSSATSSDPWGGGWNEDIGALQGEISIVRQKNKELNGKVDSLRLLLEQSKAESSRLLKEREAIAAKEMADLKTEVTFLRRETEQVGLPSSSMVPIGPAPSVPLTVDQAKSFMNQKQQQASSPPHPLEDSLEDRDYALTQRLGSTKDLMYTEAHITSSSSKKIREKHRLLMSFNELRKSP
ncbi:MAG: hypothetical protein DHS80DRAFT_22076 [Piptocephalis tieghemiana]|nr:MAG: hypothetical protein DHS80DRAFT_22076 [Piptocephalis tieghemiana]